jgi:hypothetical protein
MILALAVGLAPLAGCAVAAASAATSAIMAVGGATAMEMNANDMMPKVHEENAEYIEETFNPGPLPEHSSEEEEFKGADDGQLLAAPGAQDTEKNRQRYASLPEFPPSQTVLLEFPPANRASASSKNEHTAAPRQDQEASATNPSQAKKQKPAAADPRRQESPAEEESGKEEFHYTPIEEVLYPGY